MFYGRINTSCTHSRVAEARQLGEMAQAIHILQGQDFHELSVVYHEYQMPRASTQGHAANNQVPVA
jgi:hypothetical protein